MEHSTLVARVHHLYHFNAAGIIHHCGSPVKVLQVILLSPPLSGCGQQNVATAAFDFEHW